MKKQIYKRIDYKKKLIEAINNMPDDLLNVETSSEIIEGDMESAVVKHTITFYTIIPIKINIKLGG